MHDLGGGMLSYRDGRPHVLGWKRTGRDPESSRSPLPTTLFCSLAWSSRSSRNAKKLSLQFDCLLGLSSVSTSTFHCANRRELDPPHLRRNSSNGPTYPSFTPPAGARKATSVSDSAFRGVMTALYLGLPQPQPSIVPFITGSTISLIHRRD